MKFVDDDDDDDDVVDDDDNALGSTMMAQECVENLMMMHGEIVT